MKLYLIIQSVTFIFAVAICFALAPAISAAGVNDGFDPNANGAVNSVVIRPDFRVMVAGGFTTISGGTRTRLAAIYANGVLDAAFADPNVNGNVLTMAVQSDNKIWIGGQFTVVGGVDHLYIARVLPNGSVDSVFTSPNGAVTSMALQPDGKLLIGGAFTMIGSVTRNRLARLNSDGTMDQTFNPNVNIDVNASHSSRMAKS